MIDGRHFEPDDAASDDEEPLRDAVEFEGAGRVDHARVVVRDEGQGDRLGAGCDDRLLERHDLRRAVLGAHFELVHGDEPAGPGDDADLALLGETGKAAGEALDDAVLPAAQLAEVDRRLRERDAVGAHVAAFGDDLGGVQQRLRGDAADVEADAAETWPALDQHHLLAEIRGPERRGVAAGTGTEHQDLGVDVAGGGDGRLGGRRRRLARVGGSAGRGRDSALEDRDHGSLGDAVPDLDLHLADGAALGRRHLHRRLVGFEREQRLVDRDRGARLHMDLDHGHVLVIADIGNADLDRLVDAARTAVARRTGSGRGSGLLLDTLLRRQGGRALRLERRDDVALRDAVARLRPDLANDAGRRRRHIHGRLVRFERDDRIVDGNARAGLDVHLDHRDAPEVADVGQSEFDELLITGLPERGRDAFAMAVTGPGGGRPPGHARGGA